MVIIWNTWLSFKYLYFFFIFLGPYTFVQQHLMLGTDPRTILKDLLPETIPPPELDDMTLWQIVINILSEPPKRKKRKDINTIDDAVKLLQECKKIMVLTGAGVCIAAMTVREYVDSWLNTYPLLYSMQVMWPSQRS